MVVELEARFGEAVRCVVQRGGDGVFAVVADGRTIFDKAAAGRFPAAGEVAAAVEALLR